VLSDQSPEIHRNIHILGEALYHAMDLGKAGTSLESHGLSTGHCRKKLEHQRQLNILLDDAWRATSLTESLI
jgi:hypothetical protein